MTCTCQSGLDARPETPLGSLAAGRPAAEVCRKGPTGRWPVPRFHLLDLAERTHWLGQFATSLPLGSLGDGLGLFQSCCGGRRGRRAESEPVGQSRWGTSPRCLGFYKACVITFANIQENSPIFSHLETLGIFHAVLFPFCMNVYKLCTHMSDGYVTKLDYAIHSLWSL